MTTLVLIAKETIPGRVKTRLAPSLTLEQAAELAAASISDTLAAVADLPATRRVLLFDGERIPAGAEDYEVIPQVAGTLDVRLAALFDQIDGPTVLIGMDTPQLSAEMLMPAFEPWGYGVDAFFGYAADGGFWTIGFQEPSGHLIRGVGMSQHNTGQRQLERMTDAGLTVQMLPCLTDVDTIENAFEVAEQIPQSAFAETLARFSHENAAHLISDVNVVTAGKAFA